MTSSHARPWTDLRAALTILERHDRLTFDHVRATGRLAGSIGVDLHLPPGAVRHLRWAGTLHDVGKARIDPSLLRGAGSLTASECRAVRRHVDHGRAWVVAHPASAQATSVIVLHHERWDGLGYPHGLSGRAIPWDARIVAVADALDAMVRGRPYAAASTVDEALADLREHAGSQFDPVVVAAVDDGWTTRTVASRLAATRPSGHRSSGPLDPRPAYTSAWAPTRGTSPT